MNIIKTLENELLGKKPMADQVQPQQPIAPQQPAAPVDPNVPQAPVEPVAPEVPSEPIAPQQPAAEPVAPKKEDRSAFNCPSCGGEGLKDQFTLCPQCNGTGKI